MSDLLAHSEALWQAVAPLLPGFTVEVVPSIDSTNSELMRRARTGLMEPVLLAAEEQSAGRGRVGKAWHSRAGQSLTFSVGLPMAPRSWSGLSLAVGVSLAQSLHPDVRLKWPNDLWLHGRKLGGILVETASAGGAQASAPRMVVVGVGLNIARPDAQAVAALQDSGAALPAVAPAGVAEVLVGTTAGEVLARVAPPLLQDLLAFESQGFPAFAQRFASRDALRGLEVQLSDGQRGTACGVGEDGALQILTSEGMRGITSAEVSVRPC
ncbi:biotin--[acetyl-CoA-carboxylase] ligase [Hydrogenophaga sp.]|uniref:biotin--[acetyl-CoA-carboxylase] ligase n=1 Tax=Hydrogenophaga sp. TaxID=1904254 RepID=UPI00263609A5|nr:biotin--[acetyl-CoA-carboxylase] ligase [Hydrogenophaga sp.]MCW5654980.1 biotin--[acetyl-CoA-carboxylase] ligase [Hydrogenophaga sp.]